jgi:repressor LexA
MSHTPKQKELLDYIEAFTAERGYSPSQYEIAQHFGFRSLGTVQNYLVRLTRHGHLKKTPNARRSTQVVDPSTGADHPTTPPAPVGLVPLPLLGRVAAGRPIEAVLQRETLDVPLSMLKGDESLHFVLQVKGDSMKDDGILDGDFVVIRKADHAQNGQTVVAMINHEATLKRYVTKGNHRIELHPANSNYAPIIIEPHSDESFQFKVEGVCTGLIRRFPL